MARAELISPALRLGCVGLAAWLGACSEPGSRTEPRPFEEHEEHALAPARRPAETFYVERSGEDCKIVVRRGDRELEPMPELFACPRIVGLGERIRLAGRSCFHETGRGDPPAATVCPGRLIDAEASWRAKRAAPR